MGAVRKPWWQQATALVTVSTGGVITGFSFVPGAAATMTSPSSVPVHLLALEQAAQPGSRAGGADAASGVSGDTQLRSAIVNVAGYYLQLARTRTAAQLEALIWDKTSSDGTDHGESCAAFASLTLELAAQTVGQQSWVTGGSTYPWPLHPWADVRVDTNPASPAVTSLVADAQAHARWHAVGDGYRPQPGDWVVFDEHVEVVTSDAGGVLHTIGADSLPGLTVNAHSITGPPAEAGVAGFVDNGHLQAAGSAPAAPSPGEPSAGTSAKTAPSAGDTPEAHPKAAATPPEPAVPGLLATADQLGQETGTAAAPKRAAGSGSAASVPGLTAGTSAGKGTAAATGSAVIPGSMATPAARPAAAPAKPARAPAAPAAAPSAQPAAPTASAPGRQYATPGTRDQQAFISLVAPGAVAAQQRYGVPAAVTIAQAIEESAWGSSGLAADYHNLFGIKGTGPAGSVSLPTSEYEGGQWVTVDAGFRVYHNDAESIADHAELLATSGYYSRAMADRAVPDAFANDLTGVYATDPNYGANLVALMKLYNLYRFDTSGSADAAPAAPVKTAAPAAAPAPAPATAPAARKTAAPAAPAPSGHQTARPRRPAAAARPAAGAAVSGTAARARVPGAAAPVLAPSVTSGTTRAGVAGQSGPARSRIPGLVTPGRLATGATTTALRGTPGRGNARMTAAGPTGPVVTTAALRYKAELPSAVTTAFFASAKAPLARGEHLYRDVAACAGISWELLAAVDWLECKADPRRSPVHGERLGSVNSDGTSYATKSQGLLQCAADLAELAAAVYGIDLAVRRRQSVRALAAAFAAFRWGAILQRQHVSAMEFPYSVAGLTAHHQKMHWPGIDAPDAPDRPGSRFREPFGAVPVVLALGYPATV